MKSILREQWGSSTLAALVTIALGFVLVLWPDRSVSLMCSILGGALLVFGILYVFACVARRGKNRAPAFFLIPGAVLAGLGVWLLISAESVIALIQYVFGAVIIFHGIVDLQAALALVGYRAKKWWLDLLLSLVTLALGLVILVNPLGSFGPLVSLIGCALVYDGFTDLWLILRLGWASRAANLAALEAAEEAEEAEEADAAAGETAAQPAPEAEAAADPEPAKTE